MWTKIGNRVLFNLRVQISSTGTIATGNITIAGLPFTSTVAANMTSAVAITGNGLAITTITSLASSIANNSTSVSLIRFVTGGQLSLTDTDLTNTAVFNIAGQYPTDN